MDMRRRTTALVGTVVLLVGLAGCDSPGAGQPGGATSAATPQATSTPGSVTTGAPAAPTSPAVPTAEGGAPTPKPVPNPVPSQPVIALRGTLVEGVEGGCLILNADNGRGYLLIGLDDSLAKPGNRVEVHGYKAVGQQSICMQGILFKVTSARKL